MTKNFDVDAPRPEHSQAPTPRDPTYERLLALLELASEGSRDLDVAITRTIHGYTEDVWYADNYTTSLDAALTLVPEDAWYSIHRISLRHRPDDPPVHASVTTDRAHIWARAKTVPLALCIAALRARRTP